MTLQLNDLSPTRFGDLLRQRCGANAAEITKLFAAVHGSRAKREADQIIKAANTQAESVIAGGDAEQERQVATLRSEVDRLAKRRDAITAQLASLRDVVAGFEPVIRSTAPLVPNT